jgi:hypothetical protein
MAKRSSRTKVHPDGRVQYDYVEHGSNEHAAFLGLRPAKKGDEIQYEGWALDGEPYGVIGWTAEAKLAFLKGKVSGFLTKPPEVQSENPNALGYAPEIWLPRPEDEEPVSGII